MLSVYPSATLVIGGAFNRTQDIGGARVDAVWDICDRLILDAEITPYQRACIKPYTDAGMVYLSYHPLAWVEVGTELYSGIAAAYPTLNANGLARDFDGNTFIRGGGDNAAPAFSNASDDWLDFMVGVFKTQIDAGMTEITFDEGWGSLGPGPASNFSPPAMEGFRVYLEGRYTAGELAAKGVDDASTFNWHTAIQAAPVVSRDDFDPGATLSPEWWETMLGRPMAAGETYTRKTFELAIGNGGGRYDPLLGLITRDYEYYERTRLQEIYTTLKAEGEAYAAQKGQLWYLSSNIYNSPGWGNTAVGASVLDLPMGELTVRDALWPSRNFTSHYKSMAAIGKRFNAMSWPGQVLQPTEGNDPEFDTESLLMFLTDADTSGGVTQHPGDEYAGLVNPFYLLIQDHENLFTETDNLIALYYSLGNYMGDVNVDEGRNGEEPENLYGAARLLEDSHYSYDVLYQGGPDVGPGTSRWGNRQVSLADMQRYDLIVVPQTKYMTDVEVANFLDFVDAGGTLVAFGAAGNLDFAFPDPTPRSNAAWTALARTTRVNTHGAGTSLVYKNSGGTNPARDYNLSPSPGDLSTFQADIAPLFTSDITTDFGADVHVHKFRDPAAGVEAFHLVNFDYDSGTDRVLTTTNNTFAFGPSGTYDEPTVTYYTPESPGGTSLPVTVLGPGRLEVTIPELHVYGIIVAGDNGADLAMSKTASGDIVTLGDDLTYTVTVTNGEPQTATAVMLTDVLPAEVAVLTIEPEGLCDEAVGTVTCALGDLASGASATVTMTAATTQEGTAVNTASVSSAAPDDNAANDSASVSTIITTLPIIPSLTPAGIAALMAVIAVTGVWLRRRRQWQIE